MKLKRISLAFCYKATAIETVFDGKSLNVFTGEIQGDRDVQKGVHSFPFCDRDDFPQLSLDR